MTHQTPPQTTSEPPIAPPLKTHLESVDSLNVTRKPSTTIVLREALSETNLRKLNANLTIRQIAAQLDVSVGTIYRALKQHGIEPKTHDPDFHKPHLAELLTHESLTKELHNEALTVSQIAARYDCSSQTIYTYIKNLNIELPNRTPRTQKPDTLTTNTVTTLYSQDSLSLNETATTIGVSNKGLRDFMGQHGLQTRNPRHDLDQHAIATAYLKGATLKQLAKQHGCAVATITRQLDLTNTPRRTGKTPKPNLNTQTIIDDYEAGATISELATQHECGYRTIRATLVDNNVTIRGRSGQ